jgi:hypothetical protein
MLKTTTNRLNKPTYSRGMKPVPSRCTAAPTLPIVLTLLAPQRHILTSYNEPTPARSPEAHEKFL